MIILVRRYGPVLSQGIKTKVAQHILRIKTEDLSFFSPLLFSEVGDYIKWKKMQEKNGITKKKVSAKMDKIEEYIPLA